MSSRIVHRPEPSHECSPGWTEGGPIDTPVGPIGPTLKRPDMISHPPGTVVECECGRTWVSYKTPDTVRMMNFSGVSFRRERWWERRRRQRGHRPVAGHTSGPAYRELPQVSNRPAVGAHVSSNEPTSVEQMPIVPAGPGQGATSEMET